MISHVHIYGNELSHSKSYFFKLLLSVRFQIYSFPNLVFIFFGHIMFLIIFLYNNPNHNFAVTIAFIHICAPLNLCILSKNIYSTSIYIFENTLICILKQHQFTPRSRRHLVSTIYKSNSFSIPQIYWSKTKGRFCQFIFHHF